MTRTRASARKSGASFERLIADYLAAHIDDQIDRRVKTGAKDRGDIAGLRVHGKRVVIEVKNVTRMTLGGWITEAEIERGNDDALAGIVAHKRYGKGRPGDQYVTMTMRDLVALITGERGDEE
jgi:hypothetical protein